MAAFLMDLVASTATAAAAPQDHSSTKGRGYRSLSRKGKNGGGGGAAKKQPQRGLGVAQLEKLRLQEQQNKQQQQDHAAALSADRLQKALNLQHRSSLEALIPMRLPQQQSQCQVQMQKQLSLFPGHHQHHHRELIHQLPCGLQEKENFSKEQTNFVPAFHFDSSQNQKDLIQFQGGTVLVTPKITELSSFQIHPTNVHPQDWTFDDKNCQRKRPRLECWLRPKTVLPPDEQPDRNALGPQVEKPVMLATWLEKDVYQPEKTVLGTSLNDSTPAVTLGNSCSSASSPKAIPAGQGSGTSRLNATRRSDSGSLSEVDIESTPLSDFLTLGLPSSSSKGSQDENDKVRCYNFTAQIHQQIENGSPAKSFSDNVSLDLNLRLSI